MNGTCIQLLCNTDPELIQSPVPPKREPWINLGAPGLFFPPNTRRKKSGNDSRPDKAEFDFPKLTVLKTENIQTQRSAEAYVRVPDGRPIPEGRGTFQNDCTVGVRKEHGGKNPDDCKSPPNGETAARDPQEPLHRPAPIGTQYGFGFLMESALRFCLFGNKSGKMTANALFVMAPEIAIQTPEHGFTGFITEFGIRSHGFSNQTAGQPA